MFWRMCHLDGEPEEEHGMNQSILYNHGNCLIHVHHMEQFWMNLMLRMIKDNSIKFRDWHLVVSIIYRCHWGHVHYSTTRDWCQVAGKWGRGGGKKMNRQRETNNGRSILNEFISISTCWNFSSHKRQIQYKDDSLSLLVSFLI